LQYLDHRAFLPRFLEIWVNEADHFLRVHDKTLCILALMKIVQLPPEHLPSLFQQEGALRYLLKLLLKIFEGLPEALARREEANELTDDGDSVLTEGEEEWNEGDSWSDAEEVGDVADEAQEYLDFLAQQVCPSLIC
jgi:hypothetical protein